jgi:hypothetical protein
MIKHALPLAILLTMGAPGAQAQVRLRIDLGLPVAPPLVVIQPGVQVVEGFGEEVFFHRGWYWCRRPDGWYRARSPRDRFGWVEGRYVPGVLVRVPAGHYRNWHHDRGEFHNRGVERRQEHRELRREEHKAERREERRDERRGERRGREREGEDHRR